MADISHLGTLNTTDPINDELYADTRPFRQPPAGRYTLQAPDADAFVFGRTKAGNLQVQIDPTIVGPDFEGVPVRFSRVTATPFERDGATVSMMGDYLRACGVPADLDGTPQQAADLVESTANETYEADVDWELYAKGHGEDGAPLIIRGMRNFPRDSEGNYTHFVPSPTQVDPDTGEPVMLRGNLRLRRFHSRV